ncbi:MAG: M24 family metallopeptidase [Planctomycetes bacterium]|nr:M24 family metallopeptidase [Planctomycetota bacterium]
MQSLMTSNDQPTIELPPFPFPMSPRRADIESKHAKVVRLLADAEREALLLLDPTNVRWFASGAMTRDTATENDSPALFINSSQRWLLCNNLDTQRFFDEEIDGLGFQVKEWPWTGQRHAFLNDLCYGRRMAADRDFLDATHVGTWLQQERLRLSRFEQERLRELGTQLAHALEATARQLEPGSSEEEVAGHLAHRLLKRGIEPVRLQVAAEDRSRAYRRPHYSPATVETRCLLQATVSKFGLFASAARTVCFGTPSDNFRQEFETASRMLALWLSSIRVGDRPNALIDAERAFLKHTPFEHEYRLSCPGWWTSRQEVEQTFTPSSSDRFQANQATVWQACFGGANVRETVLFIDSVGIPVAPVEDWPIRRYVIQGERFDCPDLLIRIPSPLT